MSIVINGQTFCNRSGLYATNILAYEIHTHTILPFLANKFFILLDWLCNNFETKFRTIEKMLLWNTKRELILEV